MHSSPTTYGILLVASAAVALAQQQQQSGAAGIVWQSPTAGDVFGPGDEIIGKWTGQVVSPSVRLCVGGENGCGATVWPDVKESAGAYFVSLKVPEVETVSGYYLQIKDDFGQMSASPIFNLSPTPQAVTQASPQVDTPGSAPVNDQSPPASPPPSNPPPSNPPASNAATAPSLPAPTRPPTSNPATTASNTSPLVAAAHSAPPTAALAVPLALAGAVLLAATALALHHRARLARERAHDADADAITRAMGSIGPASGGSSWSGLERGGSLGSLASTLFGGTGYGGRGGPGGGWVGGGAWNPHAGGAPGMGEKGPLDLEKALIIGALLSDARTPLAAAVPTTSVYNARAHAHPAAAPPVRAPEPRQRTHQPFATPHAARPPTSQARPTQPPVQPRPRAPPRGPSPLAPPLTQPLVIPPLLGPHAPGYQSLRTARTAARESAPPLRNHHESHGESLEESFLQTLRQIDSEGASAGDTVVADLLSSYLPSPTFVAVPLSPPPALHVRRVAPEPAEDPEAPRVGGMYDAVARAIGAFRSG